VDTKTNLAIELGQTIYSNTIASLTEQRDKLAEENEKFRKALLICQEAFVFQRCIKGLYHTRFLDTAIKAVDDALTTQLGPDQ